MNRLPPLIELRDIMPTILEMASVGCPGTVDGRSVLPLMKSAANDWRKYIHGEHCTCYAPQQEMQYVTDGRSKFVWLPRIGQEQFFDLTTDPGECRNLVVVVAVEADARGAIVRLGVELNPLRAVGESADRVVARVIGQSASAVVLGRVVPPTRD